VPGDDAETVFVPPGQPPKPSPPDAFDGGDTTGLPPSAGGVRHVPRPQPPKETAPGRSPAPEADANATVVAQPGAPQASAGADDDGRTRLADEPSSAPGEPTGPLKIGERFGPRYRITRVLGVGGMGAVYEAWDAELGVQVALKVIRPEVAADPSSARELERRFKRELLLARQVTHKNVVRIHDLGEINGIKYITMPYIQGDDLGTILKAEGALPIPRALSITRQALSGLVAAHEKGIVHRDLKPANIMVDTEGNALLMDFGIARSIGVPAEEISPHSHHTAPGAFGETMVGAVVGTIRYMAPEQARGQEVDHRADVYAFGLIMRDMLVGLDRQMGAPTAFAELQQRLDVAPPSVRTIDLGIPEALDRVVSRCLAPEAADRYQSAAELEVDLDLLDDTGKLKPKKRVVRLPYAIAAAVVLVGVTVGVWWYQRQFIPPPTHSAVRVVIADIQNNTNDPTFDNALGQTLKRALEGASFITAFDRTGIRSTFGVQPPEKFDEKAARQLAINQALDVVLAATIAPQGTGYEVSVQSIQPLTGNVIRAFSRRASSKDQVLDAVTRVATRVRTALGDETSDSAQLLAMRSISTTSLDVATHYAAALEAQSQSKHEEALREFSETVKLDREFGLGYQGMAAMAANIGKLQDAEKYASEAVRYVAKMTDREKFQTRGNYATRTGDYNQCVKEYGDMIAQYSADVVAHNQRALCLAKLNNMRAAVDEMRQVLQILPKHVVFRSNLAVFLNYASDFTEAEREIQKLQEPTPYSIATLAFSLLGQGRVSDAAEMYGKLATTDGFGKSFAAAGLADIDVYEGRFVDAVRRFEEGAAADVDAKNPDGAAMKFTSLAYAQLSRNQPRQAAAAAARALEYSMVAPVRFLSARIFVRTGDTVRARELAKGFASRLGAENQAYAKIIEGDIALENEEPVQAIKILTEANGILDTWLGHFDLGRAYFAAKAFNQAESEFDTCLRRRGEALALMQEDPTYGHLPMVYYYQGRVREASNVVGFADSYSEYLKIRGQSKQDPLLPEVRKRAGL
jgi:serine/threonine protein kinase